MLDRELLIWDEFTGPPPVNAVVPKTPLKAAGVVFHAGRFALTPAHNDRLWSLRFDFFQSGRESRTYRSDQVYNQGPWACQPIPLPGTCLP